MQDQTRLKRKSPIPHLGGWTVFRRIMTPPSAKVPFSEFCIPSRTNESRVPLNSKGVFDGHHQ